jgi:hypothetical protein
MLHNTSNQQKELCMSWDMHIPVPGFPVHPVLTQITELTVGGPLDEAGDDM